jgi:hypothetical protein
MIAFESLLCGMALYRGFQGVFGGGALFRSGRHLVDVLVKDSIIYFLVCVPISCLLYLILICFYRVFASYATNLLVNLFASVSLFTEV